MINYCTFTVLNSLIIMSETSSSYQEKDWPPLRNLIVDFLSSSARQHNISGFFEVDITSIKEKIAVQQKEDRKAYSFVAYLLWCYGQTVDLNKEIHAFRKGKKLVLFDDVDINFVLEKRKKDGSKIPVAYILRAANKKTFIEINDEIRLAQKSDLVNNEIVKKRHQLSKYPRWIRQYFWRKIEKNPLLHKKHRGTVGLTTLNMMSSNRPFWAHPITPMPCTIAIGGIFNKPKYINGVLEERKIMCATITVNHDITDGAPATRFGEAFCQMVESPEGPLFNSTKSRI